MDIGELKTIQTSYDIAVAKRNALEKTPRIVVVYNEHIFLRMPNDCSEKTLSEAHTIHVLDTNKTVEILNQKNF